MSLTGAPADNYAISAKYYDSSYAIADLVDLPFYLDLARASSGPVLEMGCGTGRILLPVAQAGIEIHGLDMSPSMLGILRGKLESEPHEARSRVMLHEGDIRHARLDRKFALVIMPFRPFQHMHTLDDQIAALRTAAFHLTDDGKLAFDVFYPKFDSLLSGLGEERPEGEWPVEGKPGQITRRWYRKDSIDKINQSFSGVFIFRTFEDGRLVREETAPLHMTWFLYPQLRALFLLAGLDVVQEYGSFAKAALDNSSTEMIFILHKARQAQQ
jgi:SAM-dependent methyltransferase